MKYTLYPLCCLQGLFNVLQMCHSPVHVQLPDAACCLCCSIPLIPNHGNHELEPQHNATYAAGVANNTQFQSYIARNPTSILAGASGSDSPLWFSVNVGPAHMIYLSNYANFAVGSDQYEWLMDDLAA